MAITTRQQRMAALNPGCPWRGPMVDASTIGFGLDGRSAAAYLYSLPEPAPIVVQPPPLGPIGNVYGPGDGRPKKKQPQLPPARRRRKRRRVPLPDPPPRPRTPEEIEAERRELAEHVERAFNEAFGPVGAARRRALADHRRTMGIGDPDAPDAPPTVDWDSIAAELVERHARMLDEEEAEIMMMAL